MNWEMLSAIGQVGRSHWCHSFVDLSRCSDSRAEQGAQPRGNQYFDRAVERPRQICAGKPRVCSAFSAGVCAPSTILTHQTSSGSPHSSPDLPETVKACSFTIVTVRWRKALWDEVERTMKRLFRLPRSKRMVSTTRKHWLTDEFCAVVEAIIAKNPEPKLYAAYNLDASPKA